MTIETEFAAVDNTVKAKAAAVEAKVATWADFIKSHAIAASAISSFLAGFVLRGLL